MACLLSTGNQPDWLPNEGPAGALPRIPKEMHVVSLPRPRLLAIAGALGALVLASACSSNNNSSNNNKGTAPAASAAATKSGSPAVAVSGGKIVVGALHVGSINDNGYNQ